MPTDAFISDFDLTLTKIHTFSNFQLGQHAKKNFIEHFIMGIQYAPSVLKESIPKILIDLSGESLCAVATYHNNEGFVAGCLFYAMVKNGLISRNHAVLKLSELEGLTPEALTAMYQEIILTRTVKLHPLSGIAISMYTFKGMRNPLYICHIPSTGAAFKAIEGNLQGKNEMILFIEQLWRKNHEFKGQCIEFYEDTEKNIHSLSTGFLANQLQHIKPFLVDRETPIFAAKPIVLDRSVSYCLEAPHTPYVRMVDSSGTPLSRGGNAFTFYTPAQPTRRKSHDEKLMQRLCGLKEAAIAVETESLDPCLLFDSEKERDEAIDCMCEYGLKHISSYEAEHNFSVRVERLQDVSKDRGSYYRHTKDKLESITTKEGKVFQNKWVLILTPGAMNLYDNLTEQAMEMSRIKDGIAGCSR